MVKKYKWARISPDHAKWIRNKIKENKTTPSRTFDNIIGNLIEHFEATGGIIQ